MLYGRLRSKSWSSAYVMCQLEASSAKTCAWTYYTQFLPFRLQYKEKELECSGHLSKASSCTARRVVSNVTVYAHMCAWQCVCVCVCKCV